MPELYKVDKVLIENQVSPIANRMKTLQGMIAHRLQVFSKSPRCDDIYIAPTPPSQVASRK